MNDMVKNDVGGIFLKKYLFSEKYSELLKDKKFINEFDFKIKQSIINVFDMFNESFLEDMNRYDSYKITVYVREKVLSNFFEIKGYIDYRINEVYDKWLLKLETYDFFNLIELWYSELSNQEKNPFQETINNLFKDNNQPWRLLNGDIIKIDNTQFEKDLENETLEFLEKTKCDIPAFKNAYEEYISAISSYEKNDYKNAVLNSCQSYESTLKVILGVNTGDADGLLSSFIKSSWVADIPNAINKSGLKDKVLSCLPYLRNQLKVGHGKGEDEIIIPKAMAKLSINLASTLNTYIISQYIKYKSEEKEDLPEIEFIEEDLPF